MMYESLYLAVCHVTVTVTLNVFNSHLQHQMSSYETNGPLVVIFFSLSVLCVFSVRSDSHVSSSVSVKSDQSKGGVPNFSERTPSIKRYCIFFTLIALC